ncbi:MAG: leucine-rich repeat protein [Treponema sp.]|nr:leucine-rich repeat protein [Treponema sp.]
MLIYRKTQAVLIGCLTALVLFSCSGTGGAADSAGATYIMGGGGTSSANTGSGGISAIDILNRSNADDREAVVAILSQTGGSSGSGGGVNYELSSTIVLNSDDIGLPADGRVILTISGDGMDDIELTVRPDADGTVSFEIPAIQTGTTVTVSMEVQDADGDTVCIGSVTQTLEGEESQFDIKLTRCLPFSKLGPYLASLEGNDAETSYKLPRITGMTPEDITSDALWNIIRECGKFIDLSETTLPEGITSLNMAFKDCNTLTAAPQIPAGVVDMTNCFVGCSCQLSAPDIPDGVTNMTGCFDGCTSLTAAPVIPSSVTSLNSCFQSCVSLPSAPVIPASVTDLSYCFYGCTGMYGNLVIKASITDSAWFTSVCNSSYISDVYVPDAPTRDAFIESNSHLSSSTHIGTP